MLVIEIPGTEYYDEENNIFVPTVDKIYEFEHSLISISKWESKYRRPFLSKETGPQTNEEILDYFRMMCIGEFDDRDWSREVVDKLTEYLNQPIPTATTIRSDNDSGSRRIMTSEVIYAYMAMSHIPFSCETWNIHRLLMLLGVVGEFNKPAKQMTKEEIIAQQRKLNAERLAKMEGGQ